MIVIKSLVFLVMTTLVVYWFMTVAIDSIIIGSSTSDELIKTVWPLALAAFVILAILTKSFIQRRPPDERR